MSGLSPKGQFKLAFGPFSTQSRVSGNSGDCLKFTFYALELRRERKLNKTTINKSILYRPMYQNSVEFSSLVKFQNDFVIKRCHHRGVCSQRSNRDVQPTREQFEFVLVAEEKQDEETQDGDDGQHGDDDTGGRRPCKTQRKTKTSSGSLFYHIFCSARSTFSTLPCASPDTCGPHTASASALPGWISLLPSALQLQVFFVEEPPELELKAKLARR